MEIFLAIVGIVAASAVTHIYYRLTLSKSLSFFLLLDDRPLSHVNSDVRARLKVNFFAPEPAPDAGNANALAPPVRESIVVGELQHLQVVVANTGTRSIQFVEAPTIHLSSKNVILDASIIYQKPADLRASLTRFPVSQDDVQRIQLAVPMLNKGECFIVKFLISDNVEASALKLHLLSEDLPRSIKIEALAAEATKSMIESVQWPALAVGVVLLLIGIATIRLQLGVYNAHRLPTIFAVGAVRFYRAVSLIHLELLISFVGMFLIGILGLAFVIGVGGLEAIFKRRIVLPAEFRPAGMVATTSKSVS